MTNEEAIEILVKYKEESEEDYYVKRAKALEKAIRSLESWEKVKAEIVERTKHLDEHDKEDMRELAGILSILASITEHLREVTTDANSD